MVDGHISNRRLKSIMYLVGEALIGDGAEIAHIDLLLGNKEGPVGSAFANAVSRLSMGHTPLLAVVRPNLLTKPATVIIPKVTLKDMGQVNEMFGPVQAAVAKAIADSLEEGVFANVDIEDIAIIASAFVHPDAKDYNRIYRYNYGATKLALPGPLTSSRTRRPLSTRKTGQRMVSWDSRCSASGPRHTCRSLWALVDMGKVAQVLKEVPQNDHVIIEAGTPLIKKFGLSVIGEIRKLRPNAFIIADLKILDTGNLEARMAADATADAVVVSGLAPTSTIEKAVAEAKKVGIYSIIDMLNVQNPAKLIRKAESETRYC